MDDPVTLCELCANCSKYLSEQRPSEADIFDHILAIAPAFNLRIYQSPAVSDVRTLLAALNTKPPC